MPRTPRFVTALATLLAFAALALLPDAARAQGVQPDGQPPPGYYPQPDGQPPPPGYYPQPGYYQPPPPGYYPQPGYYQAPPAYLPPQRPFHYEMRPRWGLFGAGVGVFGGSWLLTTIVGVSLNADLAAIPLIGPLFYWQGSSTPGAGLANTGLLFVTLVQAAGLAMTIAGAVTKKPKKVYDASLVPLMTPGGGGLALAGHF